jgi:hypothetical protein
MNKILLQIAVVSAIFLWSCEENDEKIQAPGTIATIELRNGYTSDGNDRWVFATNEDGELLDIERLSAETTMVELQSSTPHTSIDLTIFTVRESSPLTIHHFDTYRGIPDTNIILSDLLPEPTKAGDVTIEITDYDDPMYGPGDLAFSSPMFTRLGLDNGVLAGGTYTGTKAIHQNNDDILVTAERSGVPVYFIFEGASVGDHLVASFEEFVPHENLVELNLGRPELLFVYGVKDDFYYYVRSSLFINPVLTGVVPGFSTYYTYISGNGYDYGKLGAAVISYTPQNFQASVSDTTLRTFASSLNASFDYRYNQWRAGEGSKRTVINVYADTDMSPTVRYDIPSEILEVYPSLSLSNFNLVIANFVRSSGTYTYTDMFNFLFKQVRKDEYEVYTIYAEE